jgi:hypothetical protein
VESARSLPSFDAMSNTGGAGRAHCSDSLLSTVTGADDVTVWAADAEAAASEELIVTVDAMVREEVLLRARARRTRRTYG